MKPGSRIPPRLSGIWFAHPSKAENPTLIRLRTSISAQRLAALFFPAAKNSQCHAPFGVRWEGVLPATPLWLNPQSPQPPNLGPLSGLRPFSSPQPRIANAMPRLECGGKGYSPPHRFGSTPNLRSPPTRCRLGLSAACGIFFRIEPDRSRVSRLSPRNLTNLDRIGLPLLPMRQQCPKQKYHGSCLARWSASIFFGVVRIEGES